MAREALGISAEQEESRVASVAAESSSPITTSGLTDDPKSFPANFARAALHISKLMDSNRIGTKPQAGRQVEINVDRTAEIVDVKFMDDSDPILKVEGRGQHLYYETANPEAAERILAMLEIDLEVAREEAERKAAGPELSLE